MTDSVRLEWRTSGDEDVPLQVIAMTEVAPDTWEGELPGMAPGDTIEVRVVAKGPGGLSFPYAVHTALRFSPRVGMWGRP